MDQGRRSTDIELLLAVSRYEARLVEGDKNRGECGVLGLCELRGHVAAVDDAVARHLAEREHITVTTTLQLLCDGIRAHKLTIALVERIADDLLTGEYRLPFGRGGFRRWALETGYFDPYE